MKKTHLFAALFTAVSVSLIGCSKDDHEGHDHAGHDHAEHDHDHDHDHDHGDHAHAEGEGDHGHAHDVNVAGPNGGRVLMSVEPHVEFKVHDDRKVTLTFVDEDLKPVPAAEQTATVIAGDRSAPTRLSFVKQGDVLVSDGPLPEGNDFPTVVQLKVSPDASPVIEKYNLNLVQCPTCEYQEYACTCEH